MILLNSRLESNKGEEGTGSQRAPRSGRGPRPFSDSTLGLRVIKKRRRSSLNAAHRDKSREWGCLRAKVALLTLGNRGNLLSPFLLRKDLDRSALLEVGEGVDPRGGQHAFITTVAAVVPVRTSECHAHGVF